LVKIDRRALHSSLSFINTNAKKEKNEALVGQVSDGMLRLWQPGFVRVWDAVSVEDSESLSFTVKCDKFTQIVNSCASDVISMSVRDKILNISFGKSRIRLPFYESVEREVVPPPDTVSQILVGNDFVSALNKGLNFLAKTEHNPSLTCYYVSSLSSGLLRVIASDAMKIYIADIECDAQTFEAFLLPKECGLFMIRAFAKSGEISIGLTDRGTLVLNEIGSERVVVIPPYNGQYPFSKLTDEVSEKLFRSNKKEIQNMIQLVNITSDMNEVRLSKVNSSLELYATKAQIETDLVLNNVEIFKEFDDINFNADFLSTCMSAVEGDSIIVSNFNERKNAYRIYNDERQESYCIVQSISS
jgi:hypothetical protein